MSPRRRTQWRTAWRHVRRAGRAWAAAETRDVRDAVARWWANRPALARAGVGGEAEGEYHGQD
jgi:hypothetical protein